MIDFEMLSQEQNSAQELPVMTHTLEDIQRFSLARRGLATQQSMRNGQIFVQPYPTLCPNTKCFTSVLTPKYMISQADPKQGSDYGASNAQ